MTNRLHSERSGDVEGAGPAAVIAGLVAASARRRRFRIAAAVTALIAVLGAAVRHPGYDDWRVFVAIGAAIAAGVLWASATSRSAQARIPWLGMWLAGASRWQLPAVGPLCDALRHPDQDVVEQAELALTLLLPQIQASDSGLISQDQRTHLYDLLSVKNISGKSKLLAAILTALERVGDRCAIPYVQALVQAAVDSSAGRQVKTAAELCLETLLRAEASDLHGEALLRPSEAATGTTDTLLHPITLDIDPHSLLKPTSASADAGTPSTQDTHESQ